jgi:hypothetical protein
MNAFFLKLVRTLLQHVIDEVQRQVTRVETEVVQEAERLVGEVVNGCWKGPDADRFIEQVRNEILPGITDCNLGHQRTIQGCYDAERIIAEADNRSAQQVADLNSIFARIY